MLDVHPPHGPTHTWKEFFIHLATIVVGLLIAVGLEQSVEYLHHRHQIAETRAALSEEREVNLHAYAEDVKEFHRQNAALLNNMTVLRTLQQHPNTPQAQLPGILIWHAIRGGYSDSVWRTAQQSNVTALMPQKEVRQYALLYSRTGNAAKGFDMIWPAIVQARRYSVFDPDPTHLTPAQVDEEINLTQKLIDLNFTQAAALVQLGYTDLGFQPALKKEELNSLMRVAETESDPALAEAIAKTNGRLPADSQLPNPKTNTAK